MTNKTYIHRVFTATIIVLSIIGVLYLILLARGPLLWIGIATFFSVAINPLVRQVARVMPRKNIALAAITVLVIGIAGLSVLTYLFLAPLIAQTTNLLASIPELVQKAAKTLTNTPLAHSINLSQSVVNTYIQNNISNIIGSASWIGGALLGIFIATVKSLLAIVAIISLIFFMSAEGRRWKELSLRVIEPESRKRVVEIGHKVYGIITGYVVGNLILSLIFGVSSALVLWIMKSPYWLPLGLLACLIDLIPLVGSTIAAILVATICVLSGQTSAAIVYSIFTILYVQLESNVLNPMVYSKSVEISPLIVLVSILLGGAMAGIIGALIAIPVAATIQVIAKDLLRDRLAS
jgi:predicted PurR-regulated permease PerM